MHIAHRSLSFWSHRLAVLGARSLPSLLAALIIIIIRDRAPMVQRTLLNLLRLLLLLLGPKPERRRALLFSSGFFFFFFFFIDYPGIFGGLNMVKNSWKFAHTLEPAAVRTPLRLGPGRGTEALQRPLEHHQKTWWIAHTYLHVFIWNSVHI